MFPLANNISTLGLLMQNHNYIAYWNKGGVVAYYLFVLTALTTYYIVANVLGFMAYREWKYELHT